MNWVSSWGEYRALCLWHKGLCYNFQQENPQNCNIYSELEDNKNIICPLFVLTSLCICAFECHLTFNIKLAAFWSQNLLVTSVQLIGMVFIVQITDSLQWYWGLFNHTTPSLSYKHAVPYLFPFNTGYICWQKSFSESIWFLWTLIVI